MKIFIGLGNIGEQYTKTPHNAGFLAVEALGEKFGFPQFSEEKKVHARISRGVYKGESILLAQPTTFMNRSGQAVSALMQYYNVDLEDIVILHDEIDVPLGEFKYSTAKGHAGNNGVASIIEHLKTKEFNRIRIGIKPEDQIISNRAHFVLKPFNTDNFKLLNKAISEITTYMEETFLSRD
jgi:PTH1 family peptidyl-tRNA hydrolase